MASDARALNDVFPGAFRQIGRFPTGQQQTKERKERGGTHGLPSMISEDVTLALMAFAQIRRLLPFLSVGIFIALVVDGWIFYSRWARDREAERVRVEKETQQARRTLDLMGGTDLKILNWYGSPPTIRRGAEA